MAQEFKLFDRKYAKSAGGCLKRLANYYKVDTRRELIDDIEGWRHIHTFTEEYAATAIRHAVYKADGFEGWQEFRVSLKGLSTKEKLFCLEWWYEGHVTTVETGRVVNLIRVNNYLGALKRGGFLNKELQVVK